MGPVIFLVAFLLLGVGIGYAGGRRPEKWRRWSAVAAATSLPFQIWFVLGVRDAVVLGYGFGLETESARFGFYAGLILVGWATPMWLLAGLLGCWSGMKANRTADVSEINRREQ